MFELKVERHWEFLKWLYEERNLEPPPRHERRSALTVEEVDLLVADTEKKNNG